MPLLLRLLAVLLLKPVRLILELFNPTFLEQAAAAARAASEAAAAAQAAAGRPGSFIPELFNPTCFLNLNLLQFFPF